MDFFASIGLPRDDPLRPLMSPSRISVPVSTMRLVVDQRKGRRRGRVPKAPCAENRTLRRGRAGDADRHRLILAGGGPLSGRGAYGV